MTKSIKELTLKNNFMFAAVMLDENHCRDLLERVLGFPIDDVIVDAEKCMIYHPEYKSIRLDVYAKNRTSHFNVEMQVAKQSLEKRTRYYHSQMDMNLLSTGLDYEELPDCYVIFICDFDPFDGGKYYYMAKRLLIGEEEYHFDDGCTTIFLSTKGTNDAQIDPSLLAFLRFAGASLEEMDGDFRDDYVERLQTTVHKIKHDRDMGERYMVFERLLKDEYKAGKAEGRAEGRTEGRAEGKTEGQSSFIMYFLSGLGDVPEDLKQTLSEITEEDRLFELGSIAAHATSIEEFIQESKIKS